MNGCEKNTQVGHKLTGKGFSREMNISFRWSFGVFCDLVEDTCLIVVDQDKQFQFNDFPRCSWRALGLEMGFVNHCTNQFKDLAGDCIFFIAYKSHEKPTMNSSY